MGKTNPKDQGARQVYGEVDVGKVTGTVKTTGEFGPDSALSAIVDGQKAMLQQFRLMNLYLSRLVGETLVIDDLEDE